MKSSFIFENDQYILEVLYIYEKGIEGDGWLVPDDPDELDYYKINLIGKIEEDGSETIYNVEIDIQNLLSNEILDLIYDEMQEDLYKKDYFR
tara:strand:- start:533 stop:808 length:276 start_codon:yes stop_codon:yes gene_type:complete